MLISLLIVVSVNGFAWNKKGHEVAIAVAQRHLTEQAKLNIAKYMQYDLKEDAVWMDKHKKDELYDYTSNWHNLYIDENFNYDPCGSPKKVRFGDNVRAIQLCEATLRNKRYEHLTDSAVVMNLRILIHVLPDMHCPVHNKFPNKKYRLGKLVVKGKTYDSFHQLYDKLPSIIWEGLPADDIADLIDNAPTQEIERIISGNLYDWVTDISKKNIVIYEQKPSELFDLIGIQLRDAGYRLAYLLNMYFGE